MSVARRSLVCPSQERPRDDAGWLDASPRQAASDTADFLDRPADQRQAMALVASPLFLGSIPLAFWRMAASVANASITGET